MTHPSNRRGRSSFAHEVASLDPFDYIAPTTVAEAVAALAATPAPVVLAGGTDLLPALRDGRRRTARVVDIKRVPEATGVRPLPDGGLELGAATSCAALAAHPALRRDYPGLVDALALVGGVQIRNRASLGGNLCNASPAADTVPPLLAYAADAVLVGPAGERVVPVRELIVGPGRTCLAAGELLLALRLPAPAPGFGAAYLRFTPRRGMDIAVAGAAVGLRLVAGEPPRVVAASVSLAAVAPTPLHLDDDALGLTPTALDDALRERLAAAASAAARPLDDVRGGAAQRRHLCGVLTGRAFDRAAERALVALSAEARA